MKISKKEITKILSRYGKLNKEISNNYNFIESGFIDSINLLKFITELEKKFNITIDDEYTNSKKFGEIGDLIKKINNLLKKK
tara:strand:- start:118 stop:363 length:246 start_codon:yes stop_codon:yes gene_type:complete